jgi:hypothetical protein
MVVVVEAASLRGQMQWRSPKTAILSVLMIARRLEILRWRLLRPVHLRRLEIHTLILLLGRSSGCRRYNIYLTFAWLSLLALVLVVEA